jgi:predicted Zn-dependent protease with MMP-like domain
MSAPMLPHETLLEPGLDAFGAMARRAFEALPQEVQDACGRVVFRVAEVADWRTLRELEIDHPLGLSGLYVGASLQPELANVSVVPVPEVWLYRQAILAEWHDRGNVTLEELVSHVLIHEIAHHFGWDDDQIDRAQGED